MRTTRRSPLWVWLEVVVCLVALDWLLFRAGLFWASGVPPFAGGLGSITWVNVYEIARRLETRPRVPDTALITGSSVVWAGVNEGAINARLRADDLPVTIVSLAAFGSSCTDSALIAAQGLSLHPWLVIYGAAARDFRKTAPTDSPVTRIFYDASVALPILPRPDAEAVLDAWMKRWWRLYRYRFFVRTALVARANELLPGLAAAPGAALAAPAPPALPPEALRYFLPQRVSPEAFAVWERWRRSGRFGDYREWLMASGGHVLEEYQRQTLANFGPEHNPQVSSLEWMLATFAQRKVRTVLVYFPENPAFRDPEAAPYFDASLSQAYGELFAREAAGYGARFIDLRDLLAPEDFYDLIHPNLEGMRKLSARLAEVVEEEWRARASR